MIDDRIVGSALLAVAVVAAAAWQRRRHDRAAFLGELDALAESFEPWAKVMADELAAFAVTNAEAATAVRRFARAWREAVERERVGGSE